MVKILYDSSFKKLYWTISCPNCLKHVILDLNNANIIKYGFICPFCKTITNSNDMWIAIISNSESAENN